MELRAAAQRYRDLVRAWERSGKASGSLRTAVLVCLAAGSGEDVGRDLFHLVTRALKLAPILRRSFAPPHARGLS